MKDDLDQPGTALALAEAIAAKLEQQLEDFDSQTISLSRDEAVIAFGLINAVMDALRRPLN